ncbi:unnamed protein product [Nezara viridula]|uniref:Uncharacterized protein n=1 Tax=Nezara viridula TaxID=85310 RepID=A0A9P0E2D5_NEZVI|nr:unnamed protein product [Nezara viridula]
MATDELCGSKGEGTPRKACPSNWGKAGHQENSSTASLVLNLPGVWVTAFFNNQPRVHSVNAYQTEFSIRLFIVVNGHHSYSCSTKGKLRGDLREGPGRSRRSVSRRPLTEGILTGGGVCSWLRIESCGFGSTRAFSHRSAVEEETIKKKKI